MEKKVFLFRKKNPHDNDRDCCAYLSTDVGTFQCGHYFSGIDLEGACYSGGDFPAYEEIDTVLTKKEYQKLIALNKSIRDLKFGIKPGDERYKKGIKLQKQLDVIFERLLSAEAQDFFEDIQTKEMDYLQKQFNLSRYDMKQIFDEYTLDYRDRAVVGGVFENTKELGEEEAWQLGYIGDNSEDPRSRFFDCEAFGEALVDECEQYIQLTNGRCVYLSY